MEQRESCNLMDSGYDNKSRDIHEVTEGCIVNLRNTLVLLFLCQQVRRDVGNILVKSQHIPRHLVLFFSSPVSKYLQVCSHLYECSGNFVEKSGKY